MAEKHSPRQVWRQFRSRFGTTRTVKHALFRLINRIVYCDCLHIVILNRPDLRPLRPDPVHRLSSRTATLQDLESMERQGCWEVHERKIACFREGDVCLLSYVDGELAGYTWAHTRGCPELVPGLRVSIPPEYLYNFASFTLPPYRGCGLQSWRHHALLDDERWQSKRGLLGFVLHTNFSSKKGQDKSGYKRIGSIWLLGRKDNFLVFIGKSLRCMGIQRIRG